MGIYDNIHAINSEYVPEFIPDRSEQIRKYIDKNTQRYDATLNSFDKVTEMQQTAPVGSLGKDAFKRINSEIQGKLSDLSQRKDLHNITREAYNLAIEAKQKFGVLAQDASKEAGYKKELDDAVEKGKLDSDTATRLYRYSLENSKAADIGEDGRLVGGFSGSPIAHNVDRSAKIKGYLSTLTGQEINVNRDYETGAYHYTNKFGEKVKLENDILTQLQAHMDSDPELKAMDNRDVMLATHEKTKNLTDEGILNSLEYSDSKETAAWRAMIRDGIKAGVAPKDVVRQVVQAREADHIRKNEMQIALGEAKQDITDDQKREFSWQFKEDNSAAERARKETEAKNDAELEFAGATNGTSWGSTGEEVVKGTGLIDRDLSAVNSSLDFERKSAVGKTGTAKIESDKRIYDLEKKKEILDAKKAQFKELYNGLLEQSSIVNNQGRGLAEVYENVKGDIVNEIQLNSPKMSLSDANKIAGKFIEQLKKADKLPSETIPDQASNVTRVLGIPLPTADNFKDILVNGIKIDNRIVTYVNDRIANNKLLKNAYNGVKTLATTNINLKGTSENIPTDDRTRIKAAAESGEAVVKGLDMTTPAEKIDPGSIEVLTYNRGAKHASVIYKVDGVPAKGWVDLSTSSYAKKRGTKLAQSLDKADKLTGAGMLLDDDAQYEKFFTPGSKTYEKHPFAKVGNEPINMTYNGKTLRPTRTIDGNITFLDSDNNAVEIDGTKYFSYEEGKRLMRAFHLKSIENYNEQNKK